MQPLTAEQEQQFTYYWYAARQAIEEERFPEAYALLQFCDAIKPNDAQTLYYIGVMYQVLGKQQEYIATLEQAYRVSGDKKSEDLLDHLLRIYISKAEWKQALRMQDELDRVFSETYQLSSDQFEKAGRAIYDSTWFLAEDGIRFCYLHGDDYVRFVTLPYSAVDYQF